ncbi:hypothetical protein G7067_11740 [Leucobacter insecticola]|uniref:Uncharacterized protein n=1 Tax=Leucobacter insecticola TaxID=2714934 RepID=A0A6G8FKP7_9MICO|nr:hypothetical protein [Leucobacter insecticola]QIM16918.1 hypothetical protein G7067_11740 [Leucobacter insecticola]
MGNSATLGGSAVSAYNSKVTIDSSTVLSNTFSTGGSGSLVTIQDSIVAGTATYEGTTSTGTIAYAGTNLARTVSSQPAINAGDVFTAYTAGTLQRVSDSNYVAPLIVPGPAHKAVSTPRLLPQAQNGVDRKTPLSDLGAFEVPQTYTVSFDSAGGSAVDAIENVEHGTAVTAPRIPPGTVTFLRDGRCWATSMTSRRR